MSESISLARPVQAPPVRESVKTWQTQLEQKAEKSSSRSPAVKLDGALAKGGAQAAQAATPQPPSATGHHINHVI